MDKQSSLTVLLVEDEPGDIVLFREAVEQAGMQASLHVVGDGLEALQFLRREGRHADAPRPDVIVLDLNLPLKSGREVLEELKADPSLCAAPVVVLTTSRSESHIVEGYPGGRCLYFSKTADFHELVEIVKQIGAFAISAA